MNKDKKEESKLVRATLPLKYANKLKELLGPYRLREFLMQVIDKAEEDRLINKPAGEDLPEGTVFTNNK